jgi:hypothetical protein
MTMRVGSLGILAGLLVAIWALTGPDNPWIVWPLLGLGLVAALDAWHALATPAPGEHRLLHQAGALAILNLFLVGIWIASGAGYFWPAWPMLGSAAAIGLKALAQR